MINRAFLCSACVAIAALALSSCGSNVNETPPLVGAVPVISSKAKELEQEAKSAEAEGRLKRAGNLYKELADRYPLAQEAAQARFRQAEILDNRGRRVEAFDVFELFIKNHQGNAQYRQALNKMTSIANDAESGAIKVGLLWKTRVDYTRLVAMQEKIRDAAPESPVAASAQSKIAEIYMKRGKATEAIEAFRKLVLDWPDSPEAPEGQFRIGYILTEQAKRGNQDKGNLDRAREAYQDYLNRYPEGKRAAEARRELQLLEQQDVQRSLEVAEFYLRKGDRESARFYYKEVLQMTKSGAQYDKAKAGLQALGNP